MSASSGRTGGEHPEDEPSFLSTYDIPSNNSFPPNYRDAFQNNFGVGILRNRDEGFDLSHALIENKIEDITEFKIAHQEKIIMSNEYDNSGSMTDMTTAKSNSIDDEQDTYEFKATRKSESQTLKRA